MQAALGRQGRLVDWPVEERADRYTPTGGPGRPGLAIENGTQLYNRPIHFRQNMLLTGDRPHVALRTYTEPLRFLLGGEGAPRHRAVTLAMFRLGFAAGGRGRWLDEFEHIRTTFWPGVTEYEAADRTAGLWVRLQVTAPLAAYGLTVAVQVRRLAPEVGAVPVAPAEPVRLIWAHGLKESDKHFPNNPVWGVRLAPGELLHGAHTPGELAATGENDRPEERRGTNDEGGGEDEPPRPVAFAQPELPAAVTHLVPVFPRARATHHAGTGAEGGYWLVELPATAAPAEWPAADRPEHDAAPPAEMLPDGWLVAAWGVQRHDAAAVAQAQTRLQNRHANGSRWEVPLRSAWYDTYAGKLLHPAAKLTDMAAEPARHFAAARDYWAQRSRQLVIETPDAKLNTVAGFTAAISDYCYQPPGYYHNADPNGAAWPYIFSYRQWYANEVIGDHAQVKQTLRAYAAKQLADGGLTGFRADLADSWCQTWQPSYVDQVHFHYCWTGDSQLVRDLWPNIKAALAWQQRVLDPDGDGLFVAPSNSEWWCCDFHWKGPSSVVASAITWRAYAVAAELAAVAGDAPAARDYAAEAWRIKQAILRDLWSAEDGLLGSRYVGDLHQTHPEAMEVSVPIWAGLPDAAAVEGPLREGLLDERQAYTMLRFLSDNLVLRSAQGNAYLFANDWWPTVWSHHIVSPGETSEACLAFFRAGQADEGFRLLQTVAHSVLRSASPNFQPVMTANGGQDHLQHDFGMSWGPFLRAIVEGLFGIAARLQDGRFVITSSLPWDWRAAAITLPDVGYTFRRTPTEVELVVRSALPAAKTVRVPVRSAVHRALVDGQPAPFRLKPGVGRALAVVELPSALEGTVRLELDGEDVAASYAPAALTGEVSQVDVVNAEVVGITRARGRAQAVQRGGSSVDIRPLGRGPSTAYVAVRRDNVRLELPVDVHAAEPLEVEAAGLDVVAGAIRFTVHNRLPRERAVRIRSRLHGAPGAATQVHRAAVPPRSSLTLRHELRAAEVEALSPGTVRLAVEVTADRRDSGEPLRHDVDALAWDLLAASHHQQRASRRVLEGRFIRLDLAGRYNDNAHEVFLKRWIYDEGGLELPGAGYTLPDGYAGYEPPPHFRVERLPRDLRTPYGVPFLTGGPRGRNVVAAANWAPHHHPAAVTFPVGERLVKAYLLLAAKIVPMKNYLPNAALILRYADGSEDRQELVPPFSLDCYYQHFNPRGAPVPLGTVPPGVLLPHYFVTEHYLLHADVVDICASRPDLPVRELEVRALCSECLLLVFGVTLLRAAE